MSRPDLGLFWRLLRAEGAAAVTDRLRDRLAEARRQRSFTPAPAPAQGFSCPILNVAAAAPAPRLGGVQAQLLWRLAAEGEQRPTALLYPEAAPEGVGYRLELQDGRDRRAVRWAGDGALPPSEHGAERGGRALPATVLVDLDFERAVAWAAACCGAATLVVEGLAGMPLASLLRLHEERGLGLVLAVHDFAAFCPRPHLLEGLPPPQAPRFCHYSREPERCARCLGRDFAALPADYQQERRELAHRLLASARTVVYPSAFLADAYEELFAGAAGGTARVIPPAPAPLPAARPSPERAATVSPGAADASAGGAAASRRTSAAAGGHGGRPRLHVAWVGAVQPHKGALVFEALVEHLAVMRPRGLRFSAYGGGDRAILTRWRRLPGLRVRGYYRAGALPALLASDRVDLALLLSVVPESYGLTLDECAAAGVPVVAFDLGAPARRIVEAGSGLLLAAHLADDPAAAGAALSDLIEDLSEGRLGLAPPPASAAPPGPPSAPPSAPGVAAEWLGLYRELGLPQVAPRKANSRTLPSA